MGGLPAYCPIVWWLVGKLRIEAPIKINKATGEKLKLKS